MTTDHYALTIDSLLNLITATTPEEARSDIEQRVQKVLQDADELGVQAVIAMLAVRQMRLLAMNEKIAANQKLILQTLKNRGNT